MASLEDFKPVVIKEFNDNEGIEEITDEFLKSLKQCEDEIVGSERVGDQIEFFDEDGVVLLVVTINESEYQARFEFILSETAFDLSLNNIPDDIFDSAIVTEDDELNMEE